MSQELPYKRLYSCGTHVAGHGRQVPRDGSAGPVTPNQKFARGVVVMIPSRSGDVYTVLDELTFQVLESREEEIAALA